MGSQAALSRRNGQYGSCPVFGSFWFCEADELQPLSDEDEPLGHYGFVGCCLGDICEPSDCYNEATGLQPASFDTLSISPQKDFNCEGKALFYDCTPYSVDFVGCCKVDPCGREVNGQKVNGCPSGSLIRAIYLADVNATAVEAAASELLPDSTASATLTGPAGPNLVPIHPSLFGSTSSPTPSQSATQTSVSSPSTLTAGAAAGIAVGSFFALIVIGLVVLCAYRRGQRSKHVTSHQPVKSPYNNNVQRSRDTGGTLMHAEPQGS